MMASMSDSPMSGMGLSDRTPNPTLETALVSETINLYQPTKHFPRSPPGPRATAPATITSLDFDDQGHLLLTSESDNSMQLYNVQSGNLPKAHLSQKYGVSRAIFGHAQACILHTSTKVNHTIRYLSTHDNTYQRYFEGHEKNVTCLSLHPGQDNFISCSEDNTLRIWDAATKNAVGKLNLHGAYLSAWDPSGNVFAVASPTTQSILLYDFRNFDKPPFSTFDILPHSYLNPNPNTLSHGWNKIEFSNDGKHILLSTTGQNHLLLDAFDGHLKAALHRSRGGVRRLGAGDFNSENIDPHSSEYIFPTSGDATFSPDGRYVLSGNRSQNVLVWDTLGQPQDDKKLNPVHELEYRGDIGVIAFNPRYNFFATADKEVVFWMPEMSLM